MSSDVRQLFESLGLPKFGYREAFIEERRAAAAATWAARAVPPGAAIEIAPRQPDAAVADSELPYVVTFISMTSGVGRTTLAANLAHTLSQDSHRAVAVDLDPANTLIRHFGQEESRIGIARSERAALQIALQSNRFRQSAMCIPFGAVEATERKSLETSLGENPEWLRTRLAAFDRSTCEVLVLDTQAGKSPWLAQVLGLANEIIVVLAADETAYTAMLATEGFLNAKGLRGRAMYLVNRFDGRVALQREVLMALRSTLKDRLLPFVIQSDTVVTEAGAHGQLVIQEASDSQAVADFGSLAEWVLARQAAATKVAAG